MADVDSENQNGPDAISVSKYKKLATEYAKLKAHVQVLKAALLEIRQEKDTLSTHLKSREQDIRKLTQEQESIQFVNGQLTRRVEILKSSLEQAKAEKKKKSGSVTVPVEDSSVVLEDELRSKIRENEELHTHIDTMQLEHQKALSDLNNKLRIYQSKNDSHLKQEATEILETRVIVDTLRSENDSLKSRIKELEAAAAAAAAESLKSRYHSQSGHLERQHQNGLVADSIETLSNCSSKSFSESLISTTFQESISDESPVVQPAFVVNPKDVFVSLGVFADQFLSGLSTWHGYECQMFSQSEYQGKMASDLTSAHDNLSCELKQSIANFRDFTLTLSDGGEPPYSIETSGTPTDTSSSNGVSSSFSSDSALASFQAFLVSFLLYVSQLGHVLDAAGKHYSSGGEANTVAWINADLEGKNKQLAQCYSQLAISFNQFHICLKGFSPSSLQSSHNSVGDAEMFISQLKQCLTTLKSDLRFLSKGVNQKITVEHQIEEVSEAAKTANECLFSAVHSLSRCTAKLCDVIRDNSMFFANLIKAARTKTESCFIEHQTHNPQPPPLSSLKDRDNQNLHSAEFLNSTITESSVIAENLRVIANSKSDSNNNSGSIAEVGNELSIENVLRNLMTRQSDCKILMSQLKQYAGTLPVGTADRGDASGSLTDTSNLEGAKSLNDELKRIEKSLKESLNGCEDMEEVGLANFYKDEAETLHNRLCLSESMASQVSRERAKLREKLVLKQQELESTRESYQQQLSAMSEHVCELNEQLGIFRELHQASNIASSSSSNLNPLFTINGNNSTSMSSNAAFITPSQVQFKPNYLSSAPENSNDSNSGKSRHSPSPAFSISSNPLKSAGANIRNIFK